MRLKRVHIFGFKTFADKTVFDIDADLTAVVGPNGCGKSNIVDAILWGLGESKASHIRAKLTQDVIFSGSQRRRKLGYCEVTLIFDNEDGSLPIDTPEVSVTRRVTRSGESDYKINGRTCRLRDVTDLLADSGLGRTGYAIVGQSEIDQALAASPEQRRNWIDEAAGVMRYRNRRVEALRRLESADEHLARVNDILKEIESQRKPLEKEAETARNYKQIRATLRELESGLLITEIAETVKKLDELDEKLVGAMKTAEAEATRSEELEHEAREITEESARIEDVMEAVRSKHRDAQSAFEQASAALQVAQSKLEALDTLESTLAGESEAGVERIQESETALLTATKEEEEDRASLESLRIELSGADQEARALTHELREIEGELFKARQIVSDNQKIELEEAHRIERLAAISAEIRGIKEALPDLRSAIEEASKALSLAEKSAASTKGSYTSAEKELHELRQQEESHAGEARKIMSKIAVLEGRRSGVQATLEAHEGLTQGARAVLDAVKSGELHGEFVTVGEAVTVGEEYALAIDTALGSSSNDLIVADESRATEAIALLKQNRLGRATFQPVTLVTSPPQGSDIKAVLKENGVIGLASQVVECADEHRPVIDSLLGRVVLVKDLETGLRLAKTTGWKRLVSIDGEVIHAFGGVTGGRSASTATGVVQRKAELGKIEKEIESLGSALTKEERRIAEIEKKRLALTEKLESARETLAHQSVEVEEAKGWHLGLHHEIQATERAAEKLESEKTQLESFAGTTVTPIDERGIEEKRDSVLRKLAAKTADTEQAGQRLREAESRVQQATARRIDAQRRFENLTLSEQQRVERSENLVPERARLSELAAQHAREQDSLHKGVTELQAQIDELTRKKRELIEKNLSVTEDAKTAQKTSRSMSELAHNTEIQKTRLDAKRIASVQRLLEEYGINQEEALEAAPTTEVPEDAPKLVPSLRRQLKEMGDVNLGAVEAFERLTERFDDLNNQMQDILAGKAEIMESISELDRLTSDRFVATFESLQVAFGEMFVKMFGGGEGVISLIDEKNVLDSGVDIQVTVPGKKRQRLELLSGGERALSATAFLFALLKIKPSPLVILDEVDAPLDGRNVERFVGVVREFCEKSQFIVITHNAVTMEEADAWFGVTMQEPGVSTLVPVRVPSKKMIEHVAVAPAGGSPSPAEPVGAYIKG